MTQQACANATGHDLSIKPMLRPVRCFLLAGLASLFSLPSPAQQFTFPSPVRMIVPFGAGAQTDGLARVVAAQLGPRLGTTVIVENRVGASGLIGASAVAKGPRDGSMLLFHSSSLVTTAATVAKMPFDVSVDLIPVAIVANGPMIVGISAKSGITTPAGLVAAARAKPNGLKASSSGVGTVGHLAAELLNESAKTQMLHVPYKGASQAVVDLSAGIVDMLVGSYSTLAPQIKAGRIIRVAVTSAQPHPAFPGIPTMASAANGYTSGIWYGVFAPAGLPFPALQQLNREINDIAQSPELMALVNADGASPPLLALDKADQFVKEDYLVWKRLAIEKHIVAE